MGSGHSGRGSRTASASAFCAVKLGWPRRNMEYALTVEEICSTLLDMGRCPMKALIVLFAALPLAAQPVISAKSGVVSYTEGVVKMADQPIEATVTSFPEVKERNTLRTEEGRAEVLLTQGVILRMGENAGLLMLTNRLIDTRMELLSGSQIVEADEIQKDNNLTILAKESTVLINKRGLYRFDVDANRIKVYDGTASVEKNGQTILVGSGRTVELTGPNTTVEKFDKEATDSLDRWAHRRAEQL